MTNPQWQEIKINDERGIYRMIAFLKVKVNNERSRIIATNRQRTKDNDMETHSPLFRQVKVLRRA